MASKHGDLKSKQSRHKLQAFLIAVLLVSMACSLLERGQEEAQPTQATQAGEQQPAATGETGGAPVSQPSPTPPPEPLPPALVEASPLPGSTIALEAAITLYFNQPMERASVEAAVTGEPPLSGSFVWVDDATLTYTPDQPLLPDTSQTITIATTAQSQHGMTMLAPASLSYTTSSYLQVSQTLPEPNSREVATTSAIIANFNQPVTTLGADPDGQPAGFSLDPTAPGRGEWVNTSTYIFYPDPGLSGGTSYKVVVNPELRSTYGSPVEEVPSWSFSTAEPRLATVEPGEGRFDAPLDAVVSMTFNMRMDVDSVMQNFSLRDAQGNPIDGEFKWAEDSTSLVYTPTMILQRDTQYFVTLEAGAAAAGGTPIGNQYRGSWHTVPELFVVATDPPEGGSKPYWGSLCTDLSSYVRDVILEDYMTLTPEVSNFGVWTGNNGKEICANGVFKPDAKYTMTISADLVDAWGSKLGDDFRLTFYTDPPEPNLYFTYGAEASFLTTKDDGVLAMATNLASIPITMSKLPLSDFFEMLGTDGYELRRAYQPKEPVTWTLGINAPRDKTEMVTIPLSPDGQPVAPGLYYIKVQPAMNYPPGPMLVAVSSYQTTFKISNGQAFVWAVDLDSNQPEAGIPVHIYDEIGNLLASGQTGRDGVFISPIREMKNLYQMMYAVLGSLGQPDFGLAVNSWNEGVTPWDFQINADYYFNQNKVYLYTDRPIYRPGQTIFFRAVVREAHNARYTLPDIGSYSLTLVDGFGQELAKYDLPLSAFGTAYGEYTLPEDAQPGYYHFENREDLASRYFQVAEYRKPEINLQVNMVEEQILSGQTLIAKVSARYFFDAPVSHLPVNWALYAADAYFNIPGNYQVGPYDTDWLDYFHYPSMGGELGRPVDSGQAVTNANGLFTLELPTEAESGRQKYTLEVTVTDESGLPVSARGSIYANPADFYIGVHPDSWSGREGEPSGFDVLTVDWEGQPSGNHALTALFQRMEWVRKDPPPEYAGYSGPEYERVITSLDRSEITTGADGTTRVTFTPPEPGTYQLDVSGQGTTTQVLIWVGGSAAGIWPDLPNARLRLIADADNYQPGDTASIFIPNPFNETALGLLSVERDMLMRYEVIQVEPGGLNYSLPLSEEDAPNIYLAITLLGQDAEGNPDFRQGYVELNIDPAANVLSVTLLSEPERSGPGEQVTFHLRVTDVAGKPVQGEFSLSVVDLAALALADSTAPDIISAFYGKQAIGVRTGISLAASAQRLRYFPGGAGGGGDIGAAVVREDFPDTAYWNPIVLTDANGEASLTMQLPDSLTTWQVLARGLTEDTRVGEAEVNLVTTKEVLVRPVTPRFLVAGDHVRLAAVVNNNTANEIQAEVSLQSNGFTLDNQAAASQSITIPANGRESMEWWGTTSALDSADLLFSVLATADTGSSYRDAVRVAGGALPILRHTTPQTFATSGVLDQAGERLELVSLPVSSDIRDGELNLDMSPSIAGVILETLEVLDDPRYDCNEQVISSFFPNLQTYLVLQSFGIEAPALRIRLDESLQDAVNVLIARQNDDGGWGWWPGQETNQTITAYVLLGLSSAQQTGFTVPDEAITAAINVLHSTMITPDMATQPWQLNQLAFVNFSLSNADHAAAPIATRLYTMRDQLNPWAQALLALTLEKLDPGNPQTDTLLSDLQSSAIRSSTGVHWESAQPDYYNLSSHTTNNAIVIYALAQLEPASLLLPDAVNYHIASRLPNGAWGSTYDDAWTVLSMSEYMRGSGELSSSYSFEAVLNNTTIAQGAAGGDTQLTPVSSSQPTSALYPGDPNALIIRRGEGGGRLYYNASLQVYQPVEQAGALSRGMTLSRTFYPAGADLKRTTPIHSAQTGEAVTVRLTLVLPSEAYYLVVEDYIPAGSEILNSSLKTVQLGEYGEPGPLYDPEDPFSSGWGWWLFEPARIYDERIAFSANYLPAGTYELTYSLMLLQPGEYRVLPALAWMFYFPEVQGRSAGEIFEIKP